MIYTVNVSKKAQHDMKMIFEYIALTLMEPVIAEKQYTRIEMAISSLDKMPERFRRYNVEPWRSRNLRIMPIDNYIAFYIVDNANNTVTIIRILYGARDIEKEFDVMAQVDLR